MKAVPYILGFCQGVGKEMAGSSHTPASCLSKLRSRLGAGKKQPRVWLQYVCSVSEMFLDEPSGRAERLYPSFGAPLVFLRSPYDDSEMARNRFLDEPSGKAEREDGSKWYAMGNTCSSVNEAGLVRVVDLCSKVDESMFVRIR